jgi:hypothetical protein
MRIATRPTAFMAAKPKQEKREMSDVKRLGNKLKGFRARIGKLVDEAEGKVDTATPQAEAAVKGAIGYVDEIVAELADIQSELAEDTNFPPTDGEDVKKGWL